MIVDWDIWNQSFCFFDVVHSSSCQYAAILSCVCGTKWKRFWKIQVKQAKGDGGKIQKETYDAVQFLFFVRVLYMFLCMETTSKVK